MLIRIGIQKTASFLLDKAIGTAAATGYVAQVSGQAYAGMNLAAINAFASTAAIPIVGPAAAPAAAGAAIAFTAPFVGGAIAAASSSLAGMAHSGIDNIPSEGTWLLDKGERVLSPRQNQDLTNFLANANFASNSNVKVEVINGSGEAVNVRKERVGSGISAQDVIKIFIGDMAERGPMHKALTQYTTASNRL